MSDSDTRSWTLPGDAGGRLDAILAPIWPGLSRRRLKAAFREGAVRMDGRRVRAATLATPGAKITLSLDFETPRGPLPELEIVSSEPDLLVLEKPAGVPSTPAALPGLPSIADALIARFPDLEGVGDLPGAPGLCHRLDLETSGLLLVARTPERFTSIRAAFVSRSVEKVYLAVVTGEPPDEGACDLPLGRRRGRGRRMEVCHAGSGRKIQRSWPASTRFRVLRQDPETERSLLEVRITTGVTHQIRAHLAHLGLPVLGDTLYGGAPEARLGLHAEVLAFDDPITLRSHRWESKRGDAVRRLITSP